MCVFLNLFQRALTRKSNWNKNCRRIAVSRTDHVKSLDPWDSNSHTWKEDVTAVVRPFRIPRPHPGPQHPRSQEKIHHHQGKTESSQPHHIFLIKILVHTNQQISGETEEKTDLKSLLFNSFYYFKWYCVYLWRLPLDKLGKKSWIIILFPALFYYYFLYFCYRSIGPKSTRIQEWGKKSLFCFLPYWFFAGQRHTNNF